jgi:hypothetical protein
LILKLKKGGKRVKKLIRKKKPLVFKGGSLFAGITISLLFLLQAFQAEAAQFDYKGFNISFDSTFAIGASYRVEDVDYDLIGKSNQKQFANDPLTINDDQPIFDAWGSGVTPRGAWNPNSDDGNLNFDDKDFFSQVIKGTHELDINKGEFGVFARAAWFYDHYLMEESDDMRLDIMEIDKIEDNHGRDIELLDMFVYGGFEVDDIPIAVRLGSQVFNWGEAALIRHGMNVANPIDAARIRVPGAEVKDALVPQGSLWTSIGFTESINFEGYYQYEWDETEPDSPGTYFSTSDVAGPGGDYAQLGFAQNADYHGFDARGERDATSLNLPLKYMIAQRLSDDDASSTGQFGIKTSWYASALNETEFSLYFANYHSHTPSINWFGDRGSFATGSDIKIQFVYPEDIELYGFSLNTLLPWGVACGFEAAYRKDEPMNIDGQEMAYKALEAAGFITAGTSQVPGNQGPGDEIQGYILLDTVNYDINFTKVFNNILGADALTVLGEFGFTQIRDMPDENEIRLETPGTDQSGNPAREGVGRFEGSPLTPEGVTDAHFADDFSWGYVALMKATYNDLFWNVNVSPLVVFRHDVDGTAPSSVGTFIEDRKQITLKIGFDYKQHWSWDIGYIIYAGGRGTANLLSDRDYISFNLKYSI